MREIRSRNRGIEKSPYNQNGWSGVCIVLIRQTYSTYAKKNRPAGVRCFKDFVPECERWYARAGWKNTRVLNTLVPGFRSGVQVHDGAGSKQQFVGRTRIWNLYSFTPCRLKYDADMITLACIRTRNDRGLGIFIWDHPTMNWKAINNVGYVSKNPRDMTVFNPTRILFNPFLLRNTVTRGGLAIGRQALSIRGCLWYPLIAAKTGLPRYGRGPNVKERAWAIK